MAMVKRDSAGVVFAGEVTLSGRSPASIPSLRLGQRVFQVNHANVRARFRVNGKARRVAVENGRKGNADMRRTLETGFAVWAFA